MKHDHANMPGMSDKVKKPEQGKAAATPRKEDASEKPDAAAKSASTTPAAKGQADGSPPGAPPSPAGA